MPMTVKDKHGVDLHKGDVVIVEYVIDKIFPNGTGLWLARGGDVRKTVISPGQVEKK